MAGRIGIDDVAPVVSFGRYPAKAVVGEVVPVRATVRTVADSQAEFDGPGSPADDRFNVSFARGRCPRSRTQVRSDSSASPDAVPDATPSARTGWSDSTLPGSWVTWEFSTWMLAAWAMKNIRITKTTSIIGAIWKPRLTSEEVFFLWLRFFFTGGSLVG